MAAGWWVLGGAPALVVLAMVAVLLFTHGLAARSGLTTGGSRVAALTSSSSANGVLVRSTVDAQGQVHVEETVHTGQRELRVTAPPSAAGSGAPTVLVTGLEVQANGRTIARPGTLRGTATYRAPSGADAWRLTYTLRGAVVAAGSVDGRALVAPTAVDLALSPGATVEHRLSGRRITSVGCVPEAGGSPRACGQAQHDGSWSVVLAGGQRTDRLEVQLQTD